MKTVTVSLRGGSAAELKQPERSDFPSNLGGAVQFALANVIIWVAETSGEALGSFGGSALVSFLEHIEPGLVKYYAPVIDELLKAPELPGWFRDFLTELKSPTSEAGAAVLNSVLGTAVGGVSGSLLGSALALVTYAVNRQFEPARPPVLDALIMEWRNAAAGGSVEGWIRDQGWSEEAIAGYRDILRPRVPPGELVTWAWRVNRDPAGARDELSKRGYDEAEIDRILVLSYSLLSVPDLLNWSWRVNKDPLAVRDEIIAQGYADTDADRFIELAKQRLSVSDLIAWAWRTEKQPADMRDEIIQQGYPEAQADRLIELAQFIPPVPDLVRMAVREAFSPEIAAKFGQYEDLPEKFTEWAKKQGMSEDWAGAYWAAHWDLPSPLMGFEMLHRGVIGEADLTLLLRALDIMPFWRDKLIQISYNPYTRVDIRRMHKLGILSDGELVKAYHDIGYDDEHAANLALFTIRLNTEEETEFTASNILAGYAAGMLNVNEAYNMLVDMGKSGDYASFVLAVEDYKRAKALLTEKVNYVKTLYVNWEIDGNGAVAQLAAFNLEADRIERFIEEWTISRMAKIAKPTIAQIEEWYKDGILDEATARAEIGKRKYQDYITNVMIADWDTQIVDTARAEAERAQKEQERIAKAAFRTKRAQALANLNAQIAEARLYIAELKVAAYLADTAAQKDAIKESIVKSQLEIARLQLSKAQLPITE
jgi:hypothetical protein